MESTNRRPTTEGPQILNDLLRDFPIALRAAFSDPEVGVAAFDIEARCVAASNTLARMMKTTLEDMIGKGVHDIFNNDGRRMNAAVSRVSRSGRPLSNIELHTCLSPAGEPSHLMINVFPLGARVRLTGLAVLEATRVFRLRQRVLGRTVGSEGRSVEVARGEPPNDQILPLDGEILGNALNQMERSIRLRLQAAECRTLTCYWRTVGAYATSVLGFCAGSDFSAVSVCARIVWSRRENTK